MFKRIKLSVVSALVAVTLVGGAVTGVAVAQNAQAQCGSFLGLPAWYDGIAKNGCNDIIAPSEVSGASGDNALARYIFIIVLNVIGILLGIVGYLAVIFVIYGGFLYITSNGVPDKAARAQKTILSAVIGLAIALSALAIKDFVWKTTVGSSGNVQGVPTVEADALLLNALNAVYYILASVSVAMIILGGISYATAAGSPDKVRKAKNTVLYAVVGLVIAIAAFSITAFVDRNL